MARAEIHILGSKSGYTTLASSPGISDGERAELEVLVFGDATSSEARARLERHAVMTGRPLRSGRIAISRMLPGGTDDVGRPTVEIVTLVVGAADYALVSAGLGQLAASTREWNEARRLVRSGMDLDLPDGDHDACDAGVLRAYETWVAACRAGSVGLLDEDDQGWLLALVALLEPSDQRRCRWGVGLLSVSAPVDICTLSPGAGTVGARPVLRAAPEGTSLIPERDHLQWFVEQNGSLPRSDSLVVTKVDPGSDAAPRASARRAKVSRSAWHAGGASRERSSRRMTVIAAISAVLSLGLFVVLAAAYLKRGERWAAAASVAAPVVEGAEDPTQLASAGELVGPFGESETERLQRETREEAAALAAAAAKVKEEQATSATSAADSSSSASNKPAADPSKQPADAAAASAPRPPAPSQGGQPGCLDGVIVEASKLDLSESSGAQARGGAGGSGSDAKNEVVARETARTVVVPQLANALRCIADKGALTDAERGEIQDWWKQHSALLQNRLRLTRADVDKHIRESPTPKDNDPEKAGRVSEILDLLWPPAKAKDGGEGESTPTLSPETKARMNDVRTRAHERIVHAQGVLEDFNHDSLKRMAEDARQSVENFSPIPGSKGPSKDDVRRSRREDLITALAQDCRPIVESLFEVIQSNSELLEAVPIESAEGSCFLSAPDSKRPLNLDLVRIWRGWLDRYINWHASASESLTPFIQRASSRETLVNSAIQAALKTFAAERQGEIEANIRQALAAHLNEDYVRKESARLAKEVPPAGRKDGDR
jgi:hypothetical protein